VDPAETRRRDERRQSFAEFVRGVIVNVTANIVAAAVLYLLGSSAGVFRGNDTLQALSGIVIAAAVVLLLVGMALVHRDERGATYLVVAGIVAGLMCAAAAILVTTIPTAPRILFGVLGVALTVGAGVELHRGSGRTGRA
jgi:hypothetical protein